MYGASIAYMCVCVIEQALCVCVYNCPYVGAMLLQ